MPYWYLRFVEYFGVFVLGVGFGGWIISLFLDRDDIMPLTKIKKDKYYFQESRERYLVLREEGQKHSRVFVLPFGTADSLSFVVDGESIPYSSNMELPQYFSIKWDSWEDKFFVNKIREERETKEGGIKKD